jgi:formiminoglutamase
MEKFYYQAPNCITYSGRVDSQTDYDSFRWHQHIDYLDVYDPGLRSITKPNGGKRFAIGGYSSDAGVIRNLGRRGSFNGPIEVRQYLSNKPCTFN